MPIANVNGISLSYTTRGSGPLVVFLMGTGSPGRVWDLHQTPAFVKAGYTVCTIDNRGIAPSSECAAGIRIEDLVADTAALIELLGQGPALVVGTSMGARIAQELCLARPTLVRKAVFIAGHARVDELQKTLSAGERELDAAGVELPAKYEAAVSAVLNLSPATLADESAARDWLDLLEFSVGKSSPGVRAQRSMDIGFDRRAAYRDISVPSLAIGFSDDRLIPAWLTREVADAIPSARYLEITDAGHFGYLERPTVVNEAILGFFNT